MAKRLLRRKATWERLGIGRSKFDEGFVVRNGQRFIPGTSIPRLRPVPLGGRAVAFDEDEVDALIEALRAFRDAQARGSDRPARTARR
jgi:predicted DNA-binding transcriptional regulator AlpA